MALMTSVAAGDASEEPFAAASPPSTPAEKVVLQLKWSHQFQFAGYYAAVEKGFYREVGLDVELREGDPRDQTSNAGAVCANEGFYGISNSSLIMDRAAGIPVVVIATIFQHSPLVLIARTDMTSLAPADIARHGIMMQPNDVELLSFFHSAGIAPSALKILPHSRNRQDLLDGKVAIMSAYGTEWIPSIKGEHADIALISPRSAGLDFVGDSLFTSEAEIRNHPERVQLFREASLKGWEYALAHPEEIIELILARYPTGHTREELLFEAHQTRQYIHPEMIPVGTLNSKRWEKIVTMLEDADLLTNGRAVLNGFLYDGFMRNNPRLLYWLSGSTGVVLLAVLVWGVPLVRLNRRLRREIAERRRAEEVATAALRAAETASHARNRFIATITHEIRSPLTIIVECAQTLATEEEPQRRSHAVNAIKESGQHLLQLVENILDLSKIEAGRMELSPGDFDLTTLLNSLRTIFQVSCRRKGIAFQLLWESAGPLAVRGDEGKLRQVLFNLLGNAVKFTEAGQVTLRVTPEKGSPHYYLFEVTDSGPGIDIADIATVFEPFRQTEAGARLGGTGLGLPISLHLMQLMGSHIEVDSARGRGSRFFFSVQLPPAHEPPGSPPEKKVTLADGCRVKALIVDDVEMNRAILAHMLQSLGCEARSVSTGEAAIELARTEVFNIAFVDMRMHTMGGLETARHLRMLAGPHPIRLVCFSAMVDNCATGKESEGFDDFLAKPFRRERLRQCLEALPGIRFSEPSEPGPSSGASGNGSQQIL